MGLHVNQALGTVFVSRLTLTQTNIPKIIHDRIDGRLNVVLMHDPDQWCPRDRTDFYTYRTALNAGIERAALRTVGVTELVCLSPNRDPVGAPYLAEQILKRTGAGDDVWIFQHRPR